MGLDLSIIIVNYNTADLLNQCLLSLDQDKGALFELIVVDNASKDHSDRVINEWGPRIKVIANDVNVGFGCANNQGIRISQGRYLFFLNPDTEVQPGAFLAMLDFMDAHPDIGLAGTKIFESDGTVQPSVEYVYPGQHYDTFDYRQLKGEIAWVSGASMIARKEAVEKLEGFDERFFLYAEEIDLCLRIRQAGWALGYIPDATIVHKGGGSSSGLSTKDVWRMKLSSERIFYQKHYSEIAQRRIRRANILQALWRLLSLAPVVPFVSNNAPARKKWAKYRSTLEIYGPAVKRQ